MSTTPSPGDVARSHGIEPSDGPSGDASVDAALSELEDTVRRFTAEGARGVDADEVLVNGRHLHDVLQHRLSGAQG